MKQFSTKLLILLILSSLSPFGLYMLTPSDEIEFSSNIIVGTYNLHYGITGDGVYELGGLEDVLVDAKPDIVGFQEVTYSSPYNGYVNMYQNIVDLMGNLGYDEYYIAEGYNYNLANSVFTRYDTISSKTHEFEYQNTYHRHIIDMRIKVGSSVVQILNTHLTHIPGSGESGELRIKQVQELLAYATDTESDVDYQIIMGDFNIREVYKGVETQEYLLLNASFHDAWKLSGNPATGYTSPAKDPEKTIDFIWVSSNIIVSECEVVQTLQSDHLPLFCTIALN